MEKLSVALPKMKTKDRDIIQFTAPYSIDNVTNVFGDYDRIRCESSRGAGTMMPVKHKWSLLGKAPHIKDKPLRWGWQVTAALENFFRQQAEYKVVADFSTAIYEKEMK